MEQELARASEAIEQSKVLLAQTKASIERCEAQNKQDSMTAIKYHVVILGKVKLPH